ncbi:hypothetical protein WN55_02108 [Dufourea novaeangliae]|uniref:Fas-binding factor 1 C-terminal domain-containing protein n=1 Tax=Dufourea novaeangliae TaxID=178035 RepID=A0A154NX29_DUFNO|nr:hypothetical protein WN55_02108 [Dufourea novaeangliae]
MVDLTKTSDEHLEELTQVLEDMDNSNEGDSLTGFLFDEEIFLKDKKNSRTSGSKSSLIEDLFKIKTPLTSATSIRTNTELESKLSFEHEDVNELFPQKTSNFTARSNNVFLQSESSTEKHAQKLRNVSKNEEDILANLLGNDKLDVVDDKSRRSTLKETLFENKPRSSFTKNMESENSIHPAEFTTIAQKQKSQLADQSTMSTVKEFRRGRRNAKIINDPLGLLSIDLLSEQNLVPVMNENAPARDSVVQSSKLEENLPEWLGGTKKLQEKKGAEVKDEVSPKNRLPDNVERIPTSKETIESQHLKNSIVSKTVNENKLEGVQVPEHLSLLFSTQFNQQAAIMTMQQQEHELRTANVLSQQNEQLNKVSDAQHSILHNQENQFNVLLKLQLEKQLLLEKQIKLQQERIDQYIQTLMAQPTPISSTTSVYTTCKSDESEKEKCLLNKKEELENAIKVLQVEKSKLESTLSTISEIHNNEMIYQAEFYERQVSFLKEGILKFEEKTRQDAEILETDYMAKLEKLRNEKVQMENLYKEEIHNLKSEHAQHIQEINELHSKNVKFLQKEYLDVIENICKAKKTEDQVIESITTQKIDIENMLQKANSIIGNMKEFKEKVDDNKNNLMECHENYLKVYEDDIKAEKLYLKNRNSIFEGHQNKFIETTEKFGNQLMQLISELQKQTTQNNQMQEMFENRATNLVRERELFEEKVRWERDYLQTLKESWVKEQERQLKLLAEEREVLTTEKVQLQITNRLKINSDDIAKVELEAAIQTAQEAITSANQEKLKWQEKLNELNVHEQILQGKERLLVSRAKELEKLTQSALTKKEEGIKALKDAKHLENQHKEKLDLGQMISVSCETEKPERDVNVSYNFQNKMFPFSVTQSTSQMTSDFMKIVDPNLVMLKLNHDNHYYSIT